jgi:hypothetical protein
LAALLWFSGLGFFLLDGGFLKKSNIFFTPTQL